MAEEGENSNYLSGFLELLNEKRESAKPGVVKDSAGKVSPTLTPGEVGRYKNIFKIMKDVVDPNPEAANIGSTKEGKVGKTS